MASAVQAIFEQVIARPEPQREAFLESACGEDPSLRGEVEALLAAHARADGFLDAPTVRLDDDTLVSMSPAEAAGTVIGRYKLLQPIGEGGFGRVFMAEQREPVSRRVALKVIKLGMDTEQVIARFEVERQALAMMDHPNIARVLDAGATEAGRPYFVMELVRGVPITEYCDQNDATTAERLELFARVCNAVQHAHQKGIIHRDLKPSNILVTQHDDEAVPKVIDFGIAKATNSRLTERTLFTEFRQFVGTPEYMSPEQAEVSGLDIDTRSDIYSLGVLLYELLVGATPFDAAALREQGYAEIQRIIREEEPPRPSTRYSTLGDRRSDIARHRGRDPEQLSREVRGELDWIVMRAMEKNRARRYDTASGLADEIRRFLRDEPVEAGPPSAFYRLRKIAKRHRTAIGVAALVAIVTISALVATTYGLVAASREAELARQAEASEREQRLLAEQRQEAITQLMAASGTWLTGVSENMTELVETGRMPDFRASGRKVDELFERVPPGPETLAIGELADGVEQSLTRMVRALVQVQAGRASAEGRLAAARGALLEVARAADAAETDLDPALTDTLVAIAQTLFDPTNPQRAECLDLLAAARGDASR